ncbi:hypothetical protein [Nostoc sp.]|uniref:hypothetical protein n=1 Tax=Nostoc sp. TaxID=1180 RepID=UPI002FF53EA3
MSATSSGYWASEAAANYARQLGTQANQRTVRGFGEVGVSANNASGNSFVPSEVIRAVQAELRSQYVPYRARIDRIPWTPKSPLERNPQ